MSTTSLRAVGALSLASLTLAACSKDTLNITNPNTPSVAGASSDPQALQLLATGLLRQNRNSRGGFITETGRFGREAYVYTPQEGRNTSAYLIGISGQNRLDPAGFAVGSWGGPYGNLRDVFNFKNSVNASNLSAEQKRAALGFAKTIEGIELLTVIATRDTIGAVVQINQDATQLAPFVSRDSTYRYILGILDEAAADLSAGGAAFPFSLNSGFTGFNTPSTFRQFNRAMAARAAAYYATAGGGAAAWTRARQALDASFININATTAAAYNVGVYHPYGASPDAPNPLAAATNTDLYAHMSIDTDAPLKADGTKDNRFLAKIGARPTRNAPQGLGVSSSLGFQIYPAITTTIPIIRNEELILLRAEILLATGDKAGAIAMINNIRVNSGGLAPTTLTAASPDADIVTEILVQKRYSLLLEGHRWIDMRRYGRLNQLPRDLTTGVNAHFVARVQPLPQAECLQRVGQTGALAGPGC
ncbi:RagB/SusD family nutrient uptake outer membrane protein [Gemmatimonas sp.]|uniref:RagB/SusD family nutrient uptake outer membrane protein n=1 Tax=Gemmatimonas sp. TaxID=1962908 RepID=UPI0025BC8D37|nr:RagB/SusD family nutrient uptake outer membrane protein [Gemmatimonas sp.]MCA2991004.1 RagB/SusD family nutrient uptake outer membrane protein [Gemmatimonas sp.]